MSIFFIFFFCARLLELSGKKLSFDTFPAKIKYRHTDTYLLSTYFYYNIHEIYTRIFFYVR